MHAMTVLKVSQGEVTAAFKVFVHTVFLLKFGLKIIRGEPERAPNTRGTGSGFICIYIFLYVCLWGDHFSEERVKV